MTLGVVGSRSLEELGNATVIHEMEIIFDEFNITKVVSGGAKGPDRTSVRYAKEKRMKYEEFIPDWERYGKKAGFLRNKTIIENSDILLAFWDGFSKGTKNSIDLAKAKGIPYKIILISSNNELSEWDEPDIY